MPVDADSSGSPPRRGFWGGLRHAFAVDPPGPAQPTEPESAAIDRLAGLVAGRGMTVPAVFFLEMSRPLNYLTAQALHFFSPFVSTLLEGDSHRHLATFLERRGSIEFLCDRLEEIDRSLKQPPGSVSPTDSEDPGLKP